MEYPKRSQYKYAKSPCRIRNWRAYEAGLRSHGDLTVWLSDDAVSSSRALTNGKPGGQRIYANIAIETALRIRMVFHLPLRQTEGLCGCYRQHSPQDSQRNRNIRSIRRIGRREWHKRSGFSRRSKKVLNTKTSLGMPDSYQVG